MEGTSLALEAIHFVWDTIKAIREAKEHTEKVHAFFDNQLNLSKKSFDPFLAPVSQELTDLVNAVSE